MFFMRWQSPFALNRPFAKANSPTNREIDVIPSATEKSAPEFVEQLSPPANDAVAPATELCPNTAE
jgi:hypothetical protein